MKWLIVSRMDMTFKDVEKEMISIMDVKELTGMIRSLIIERAQLPNISKDEFEKILSLYRQKYTILTNESDFYNLKENIGDLKELLNSIQEEMRKKYLDGPELAIDYVLSIFPENKLALKLKEIIKGRRNK